MKESRLMMICAITAVIAQSIAKYGGDDGGDLLIISCIFLAAASINRNIEK